MEILNRALVAGKGSPLDGTAIPFEPRDLERVGPEDIKTRLDDILLSDHPEMALVYLKLAGFLEHYLPDIYALWEFDDGSEEYKNLWEHTLKVVSQTPASTILRWTALLHDIGKIKTKKIDDRGRINFIGHEQVGAAMASKIMKKLRFRPEEAEKIRFLVLSHLRCTQYDSSWTDSAVRRLGKDLGEHLRDCIEHSKADITTKHAGKKEKYHTLLDELSRRHEKILEEDSRPPHLPSGLGNQIMQAFDLQAGPAVGKIRSALQERVESGTLEPAREPEYYIEYLKNEGNIVIKGAETEKT
ncbi:MAG: HDIG domain-containing metalloprotein [Pseudomonadota bacterium]